MNVVEKLSLEAALPIGKPFIHKAYFPLLLDKFITFNICKSHPSRHWDGFQDCVNLLLPYLEKEKIKIVQLGQANDPPIGGCHNLAGSTSPNQCAYIMEKSLLHFGASNFLTHLAAFLDKPTVTLYGDTLPSTDAPMWGKNRTHTILEGERDEKPTYSKEETPKSINFIYPEKVAEEVLSLLNIKHNLNQLDPFFLGSKYFAPCLEVVPDFTPPPSFFPQSLLNVRMDYHFDEDILLHFTNNRKLSIITDKPLTIEKMKFAKSSLNHIFYLVDLDTDPDYIHALRKVGVPISLFYKGKEKISQIRLNLLDFIVDQVEIKTRQNVDNEEKICDVTHYKSGKALFSKGKEYSSKAAWEKNLVAQKDQPIIDSDSFWDEIDHFKIYNKNDEKNSSSK